MNELGRPPGVDNIMFRSNGLIDDAMHKVEADFDEQMRDEDPRANVSRFVITVLKQVADTRRELNGYIEGTIVQTSQRLRAIATRESSVATADYRAMPTPVMPKNHYRQLDTKGRYVPVVPTAMAENVNFPPNYPPTRKNNRTGEWEAKPTYFVKGQLGGGADDEW